MPTAELTRKSALISNFQGIQNSIKSACEKAGRNPAAVELLAVTKYAASGDVKILIEAGAIKIAGENKVQDAKARWTTGELAPFRNRVQLHFIGHLQTNKARTAVEIFDAIDSIDSLKIAAEINRHAAALGKTMPVMIQLKLNASPTQSGVTPDKAGELLAAMRGLGNIVPCGYLGIAPAGATAGELRTVFAAAKKVFDRDFPESADNRGLSRRLSLGMSADYEPAVEAGSTLPRIGSSLFA